MTTETTVDLFTLIGETVQALSATYGDAMAAAIEQGGMVGPDWGWLFVVQGAEPRATFDRLAQLRPYAARETLVTQLAGAVGRGLLSLGGNGEYQLTEAGRQALRQSFAAVHAALAGYNRVPEPELQRAVELLERVVHASVAALEPAAKPTLLTSRRTDPGSGAAPAARIDQYLTDLLHYRDDTHMAAWQPSGASGPAWEILTLIWRGEAQTVEELQARLERRGHTAEAYSQYLHGLIGRGWVAERAGRFELTDAGRALREQAEETTNRLFYGPWACLSAGELEELRGLLVHLRDTAPAPNQTG
jgi:DNA-binding MarR family transcriptional regulator